MARANSSGVTERGVRRRGVMCLLLALMCAQQAIRAQVVQSQDARYFVQQATKDYEKKDYQSFVENMKMANSLRPTHQSYMYYLAAGYALIGNQKESLAWLDRGASMGLVYPADKEPDFASLKDSEEFKAILKKIEHNRDPINHSTTALTVHEKGLVPEGIAYDPVEESYYLSSVHKRKIVRIDRTGTARDFSTAQDGLWSTMGMKVDPERRLLWVSSAAHPQMSGYRPEENGNSAILKYDLKTGKLLRKYIIRPAGGKLRWLGDLTVNSRGDVFTTDSVSPAIYVIRREKDEIELWMEDAAFVSPQGLAFTADEKYLLMSDYSKGIFVIDPITKKYSILSPPPHTTLLGIDGIYTYRDSLIGVQNGIKPQRIVRLYLNRDAGKIERFEVLEANNPVFDEPTLGVVVKDAFFYISNSQWGLLDKEGHLGPPEKLRDPVILKARL